MLQLTKMWQLVDVLNAIWSEEKLKGKTCYVRESKVLNAKRERERVADLSRCYTSQYRQIREHHVPQPLGLYRADALDGFSHSVLSMRREEREREERGEDQKESSSAKMILGDSNHEDYSI